MLPTTERVPGVFTVTVDGTQIELPTYLGSVAAFPQTRDEFVTILSGLLTIPGASEPSVRAASVSVSFPGTFTVSVFVPAAMTKPVEVSPVPVAVRDAVADALGLAVAS